jgi:cardiolipin synthase (CMP-forming)
MIPNIISLSRIVLIPVFLYLLFQPDVKSKIIGLLVFIIASITDILDGWSARTLGQESELGKFLDPLADKFLVIATLISFVIIDPLIPLWVILIIVGRDILITLMRYAGIKKGMTLRTSRFGKVKTAFQMVSIVIIFMVFIVKGFQVNVKDLIEIEKTLKIKDALDITMSVDNANPYKWLVVGPYWLMMIVTLLTAVSGFRYMMYNWRLLIPPYHKKESK